MGNTQYPGLGYTKCENGFAAAIPDDANNTKCNNVSAVDCLNEGKNTHIDRLTSIISSSMLIWAAKRPWLVFVGTGFR